MKRRLVRNLRKHRTAFLALAVYHFVFFFPILFMGRVVSPNDVFYNFSPWQNARPADFIHVQNSLLNDPPTSYYTLLSLLKDGWGTFHWNPYVASGIPGLGSSASASLTPFVLLPVLLLPLAWVYTAIVFLKLNVAFYFAYLWLREERLGKRGAAVGALVASAAGTYAVRWLWQITNATALYPALLWIVRRTANRRRIPLGLMALIALSYALSGFPAAMAYGAWLAGAYALFLIRRMDVRGVTRGLAAAVIALLVALPSLVPFIQFIGRSGYLTVRQSATLSATYPQEHWLGLVQPDRLGNPVTKDWRGTPGLGPLNNYVELTIYLGLLTLPLAMAGLFNRRARGRWFWLAAAVLVLGCMFGAPLISVIAAQLPGVKYSALTRVALLLPLPMAWLAAAGTRFFRRFGLVHAMAALLAFDLGVFAGRFFPYLERRHADVEPTPMTRFLGAEERPFRIAPFFNYLWPNSAELIRVEDVRSHFSSEAAYRQMMLRLDPTVWTGSSTFLTFNSLHFRFDDPLVALLGIRWFIEHKEIDIIKWGIFKATVPGVKETGTIPLKPGDVFQRTIDTGAEPFWSIELPVHIEEQEGPRAHLEVTLLKNGARVWSRSYSKDEANVMNKIYVPLRPYARLGESVVVRVASHALRGWMLEGENPNAGETRLFYGRVTSPVMFERELPDGRLFRNIGELPRFRPVSRLRKLNDEEFLAARDVDFATEAVITDDPVMPPALMPGSARIELKSYAPDEQRVTTEAAGPFFLASSEKLTPELAVTIDGRPVPAVECDMLFAGVTVPGGRHEVVFSRRLARGWWWTSIAGVLLWLTVMIAEAAFGRRSNASLPRG